MEAGTVATGGTHPSAYPGGHRLIVAAYVVLTLAALGRSSFQVLTKFDQAPLAYGLSALAAAVYVLATISLALSSRPRLRTLALYSLGFELSGVLVVGILSVVRPEWFPEATVWSDFGLGYLLIPLFLPMVGLWWLRANRQGSEMSGPVVNYGLASLPGSSQPRAITIGKFDGVHRGHQSVVDQLLAVAGDAQPTVITFDRHPHATLKPLDAPLPIISESQKIEMLHSAGIARVVVLAFDEELSSLSHRDFTRTVLVEGLGASVVLVGSDFRYGEGGKGTIETLREEGAEYGFRVEVVADVCEEAGQRVSSTLIRGLLEHGDVSEVAKLLGRYHAVRGEVGQGFQRGRELGYPTANLKNNLEGFVPADGVYATYVTHAGVRYEAATSVGVNPTFGDMNQRTIESHLMNSSLDLYGATIQVEFVAYIRGMKKFDSPQALAAQMGRDEQEIVGILEGASQA